MGEEVRASALRAAFGQRASRWFRPACSPLLTKLFTIAQNFHANSPLPSAQVLNANLADPDVPCGSVEVGGIWRSSCKWPFRCCSTWRPPHTLTEHGSPLSRATTRSTLSTPDSRSTLSSTTVVDTPPRSLQDDQEVREVAPPTPGAHVTKDPEHPYMPTPVRANQVTTSPLLQPRARCSRDFQ